ncbi:kinesin-like protein kin-10c [Fagus crenata]
MASTPSGQPDRTKPTTTRKVRVVAKTRCFTDSDSSTTPWISVNKPNGEASESEICAKLLPALAPDTEASEEEKEAERKVKEEMKEFEMEFLKEESNEGIKELILAANYLNIKEMLEFLNKK